MTAARLSDRMALPSAEQSVLGAILLRPEILGWLEVSESDFFNPNNRHVFLAMKTIADAGAVVDDVTLEGELRRRQVFDGIGGWKTLRAIAESVVTWQNVEVYAKEIRRHRISRETMGALSQALDAGNAGAGGEEFLSHAMQLLGGVRAGKESGAVSAFDAAKAEADRMWADMEKGQRPGILTGLAPVDKLTGGLPIGIPMILAARPSVGKSALALRLADYAAANGTPAHVLSNEDKVYGFAQRALANHSGVDVSSIRSRSIQGSEASAIWQALDVIKARSQLYLEEIQGFTVEQVIRRIRVAQKAFGTKLVIVDYLQLIKASHRGVSTRDRVSYAVEALADLAGTDNLALVIVSQLNRESDKDNRSPRLSDLAESGQIERVGKLIVALHDAGGDDELELHILKNHQGPIGRCVVNFDRAHCRIW